MREIEFKSYVLNKNTGEVTSYVWKIFPDDGNGAEGALLKPYEEIIAYGLQYIGINDKNGIKIYEHDRVFDSCAPKGERELFTVRFDNETARFVLDGEGEAEWDETDWQVYDSLYKCKPTREIIQ